MGKKQEKLPKTIYVRVEQDGEDNYLVAARTPEEISSARTGKEPCGRYALVAQGYIKTESQFVNE